MGIHKWHLGDLAKLKEWWWRQRMYKDMMQLVDSCVMCQKYSTIQHRDDLIPTLNRYVIPY